MSEEEEEEKRVYQYRVWDTHEQKWVDPDLICLFPDGSLFAVLHDEIWEVEQERYIIELATGYTDMHGTMVYQGDIMWSTLWPVSKRTKVVIEWTREEDARLEMVGFITRDDPGWEIIGNIHENPNLLEKVKGRHDE